MFPLVPRSSHKMYQSCNGRARTIGGISLGTKQYLISPVNLRLLRKFLFLCPRGSRKSIAKFERLKLMSSLMNEPFLDLRIFKWNPPSLSSVTWVIRSYSQGKLSDLFGWVSKCVTIDSPSIGVNCGAEVSGRYSQYLLEALDIYLIRSLAAKSAAALVLLHLIRGDVSK
jgi:hypothetical protein